MGPVETDELLCGWGRTAPTRSTVLRPGSEQDAVDAVLAAGGRGVLGRGLGRGYGDCAQNAGGTVVWGPSMSGLLDIDLAAGVVRARAGTSLDDLMRWLVPHGLFVPVTPGTVPDLRVNWNPFTETWRNLALARERLVVFRSLLGISWIWFFGAVFLSQFPGFAKDVLHGNEHVASVLLVVFSLGIGTGSLLCETFSRRHVEIGLVPLGALGMSLFAADLYFASRGLPAVPQQTLGVFLAQPAHWRVLADLFGLALCAGLYSVPMYALIQLRAPASHRARIIAANNILNALFMIASSLIVGGLLAAGLTVPQVFGLTALANLLVGAYIFLLVPEYLLRFVAFVLSRVVYRFRVRGDEHIPAEGAAIVVCNHVSFVDAVLLMAASPRPIRFVMDHRIFQTPVLGWLFRLAKAIPIAPRSEVARVYDAAFEEAARVLAEGDLLGLFPEGGITRDGSLQEFKGGIMKILERQAVPVVPVALHNLWGSFFSRVEGGKAMVRPFRRGLFSHVVLVAGPHLPAAQVQPGVLREHVAALLAQEAARTPQPVGPRQRQSAP